MGSHSAVKDKLQYVLVTIRVVWYICNDNSAEPAAVMTEAVCLSETSVYIYQAIRNHILQDSYLQVRKWTEEQNNYLALPVLCSITLKNIRLDKNVFHCSPQLLLSECVVLINKYQHGL